MTLCSACGAPLARGMLSCPKCLLPLTAQAIIVPVQPRTINLLPWTIGAFALLLWVGGLLTDRSEKRQSDAEARLKSDLHGGILSTPQGFQSRCGTALKETRKGAQVTLIYDGLQVYFDGTTPDSAWLVDPSVNLPMNESMGMDRIDCKHE